MVSYRCDKCRAIFPKESAAQRCENSPNLEMPGGPFKVGDVVTLSYGYGWFDGNPKWVINPDTLKTRVKPCPNGNGNCFDKCCTIGFYYVITAITTRDHETLYHLVTKAIVGKNAHSSGYTCFNHHKMTKVEKPPVLPLEDHKKLIGETFKHSIY